MSGAGGRIACVDLPALGLQLLCRRQPEWRALPAVRVAEDRPEGKVLEVNAAARALGVLAGMRYAAALSLAPALRAAVVGEAEVGAAVDALRERLRRFSPAVEANADEAGVFWLDAGGLDHLWPSPSAWARALRDALDGDGWVAVVAVAPSRFGAYALARGAARARGGVLVVADAASERRSLQAVALDRLALPPKTRDALARLGVARLGELLALPADGVRRRFGDEALRLWRMAAGDWRPRLRPEPAIAPVASEDELEHELDDTHALLFLVKRALPPLLAALGARHERLAQLDVTFTVEPAWRGDADADRSPVALPLSVTPAEATLDEAVILDLLRLRLERVELAGAVVAIALDARGVAKDHEQLRLGVDRCRRDLRAAALAIARVRADLGDERVVRAELCDGHLPEQRYTWRPTDAVAAPAPTAPPPAAEGLRTLVRRLRPRPVSLPPQPRHVRDEGWLVQGLDHGSAVRSFGPYIVSGGWWGEPWCREYQFTEMTRGEVVWIYYERSARRWFLQGEVG